MILPVLCISLAAQSADEPIATYTEPAPRMSEVDAIVEATESRGLGWARGELAVLGPEAAAAVADFIDREGLDPRVRKTILETLEGWPLDRVVGSFAAYLDPAPAETVQRWLLGRLAKEGQGPVLGTYLAWISNSQDAPHLRHPSFQSQLAGTILELGSQHPSAFDSATTWLDEVAPVLAPVVAESLLAASGERVCPALQATFGRDPMIDRALIAAVRNLSTRVASQGTDDLRALIHRGLMSSDSGTRTEAAYAIARFGELDSLETLLGLLESESDSRTRRALERAVHGVSGLRLTGDLERLRQTVQFERDWAAGTLPSLIEQAMGESVASAIPALRTLSGKRMHRQAISVALLPGLRHNDPIIAGAVARTLGDLGHEPAILPLAEILDDEDPGVRASVLGAMTKLSGQDFGDSPEAWWDWLTGS